MRLLDRSVEKLDHSRTPNESSPAGRHGTKHNGTEKQNGRTRLLTKKANYADETIRMVNSALRTLIARGADLSNPETIKDVVARQNWFGKP